MYRLTIRIRSDNIIRPNRNTLFGPLFGTEANTKRIFGTSLVMIYKFTPHNDPRQVHKLEPQIPYKFWQMADNNNNNNNNNPISITAHQQSFKGTIWAYTRHPTHHTPTLMCCHFVDNSYKIASSGLDTATLVVCFSVVFLQQKNYLSLQTDRV